MDNLGGRDAGLVLRPPGAPTVQVHEAGRRSASLLDLDPDLASGLSPSDRLAARGRALVAVERLENGSWEPLLLGHAPKPGVAVLVVDGLLIWEVEMTGHISAELLGAGDVIYPWETGGFSAPSKSAWRVIVPARAALLDARLFARIAPWPALACAIASRSTRRGRLLAALALTRRMRRIDDRLVFVFALFAERWGKVGPDGVRLSLPVTHELLGRVVGARRQSVTTALSDLRERGVITALSHGQWLLTGPLDPAALLDYARTTIAHQESVQ
jgi:CRP/FNR family cyclic AMP-dependent transcriptional regulator